MRARPLAPNSSLLVNSNYSEHIGISETALIVDRKKVLVVLDKSKPAKKDSMFVRGQTCEDAERQGSSKRKSEVSRRFMRFKREVISITKCKMKQQVLVEKF